MVEERLTIPAVVFERNERGHLDSLRRFIDHHRLEPMAHVRQDIGATAGESTSATSEGGASVKEPRRKEERKRGSTSPTRW